MPFLFLNPLKWLAAGGLSKRGANILLAGLGLAVALFVAVSFLHGVVGLVASARDGHWKSEIATANAKVIATQAARNERAVAAEDAARALEDEVRATTARAVELERRIAAMADDPIVYPAEKGGAQ